MAPINSARACIDDAIPFECDNTWLERVALARITDMSCPGYLL